MFLTRRSWALLALVVVLAIASATFARPVLLAGGAMIGAWVLASQLGFVRDAKRATDGLTVDQRPERSGLRVGESVSVTLEATLDEPVSLELDVEAGIPTGATAHERVTISLDSNELEAERTDRVSWPVTGRHRFDAATVTVTDGLFGETLTAGHGPNVTVEPRGPRQIHVGEGGDRFAVTSGGHRTGRLGPGLEPAELREYVPGDSSSRIDWKATARLATPYVRRYEVEAHRPTLFVVDHRADLSTGPPGETKLEYLREVVLAAVSSARQFTDPIGLLTVGNDGYTERHGISSGADRYADIRRTLLELEPTTDEGDGTSTDSRGTSHRRDFWPQRSVTPVEIRRTLADLGEDESAFAATLHPFYADQRRYRERIESKPLYGALRAEFARETGRVWTVIFSDDSNVEELYETVRFARSKGGDVVVILAPTVLFEPGEFDRIDRAYDRYRAFEEQRRTFARMDRVTALEVAPGDRLSTVLAGRPARGAVR